MAIGGKRSQGIPARLVAAALLATAAALIAVPARAQDAKPLMGDRNTVTISTRNMPLTEFLELLSVSCKLNIVCPKDTTGNVSANFYEVPPLDVLKSVLEANGYQYTLAQTSGQPIIKIHATAKVKEGEVPLAMRTFVLKYATADDVVKAVTPLLGKTGTVSTTASRNALVAQDTEETLLRIDEVVKLMDAAPQQVMIDAQIIEIGRTQLEELGFNWSMFQNMNIADITAEASYTRVAQWTDTNVTGAADTDTRNIVRTTGTNIDLRGGILAENDAQLALDFFDTLTGTTVISRPGIRTIDNRAAHIISGQIVPIPLFDFAKDTGVRTLSGFQEEQIGVELTVTPHINDDGYITLEINPKVESIDRYIVVDGTEQRPVKNTRQATTTIRIKDGNTAVIGGLTATNETITTTGLPWFKNLPLIGFLFRRNTTNVTNNDLVIFITPKIIDDTSGEPLSTDMKKLLKKSDESRIIKWDHPKLPSRPKDDPEPPASPKTGLGNAK